MSISPKFWLANRITPRSIDLLFHITSAGIITAAGRQRFIRAGIDEPRLNATLHRIRTVNGWDVSWAHTARGYLGDARAATRDGDIARAAHHRASAALCYHFGTLFVRKNPERRSRLARRAVSLFEDAAPNLPIPARSVQIPWRHTHLPGYLIAPEGSRLQTHPVLVILNGASTIKEETTRWAQPFIDAGIAVLTLDTPGSGELAGLVNGDPHQADIGEAILDFVSRHDRLEARQVFIAGISLRGALAVQLGVASPGLAGVAAITAPFEPAPYLRHLSAVVRQEVAMASGAAMADLEPMAEAMSLATVAPRLSVPLFVVGAGNDLVVPPEETLRLYRAASGPKQLLYFEKGNHIAISHMPAWTKSLARWAAGIASKIHAT